MQKILRVWNSLREKIKAFTTLCPICEIGEIVSTGKVPAFECRFCDTDYDSIEDLDKALGRTAYTW